MDIVMKIEIPSGSSVKYEINKVTGELEVDRILNTTYPGHYGYIKHTLADDGDNLDAFLIHHHPSLVPGCILNVDVIGVIEMTDNGIDDYKLIVKQKGEQLTQKYIDTNIRLIKTFLRDYKDNVIVGNFLDKYDAKNYLQKCKDQYQNGEIDA